MNVYRKSLVVQLILFIVFFVIGANIIINFYLSADFTWIGYVVIALLVSLGVLGFTIYRKQDTRVSVVTQKEMKLLRYLLYGYFGVYILELILQTVQTIDQQLLAIATGSVLMLIALVGIYLQYKVIRIK